MFADYRSRFLSLSRSFRSAYSQQQALSLAGDLAAALADLAGDLAEAEQSLLKTTPTQQALNFPDPEYVEIPFSDLKVGDVVWMGEEGERERSEVLAVNSTDAVIKDENGRFWLASKYLEFFKQV